ncbi:MAG: CYTH domain-containing protein [Burkholderiales bacterium]|nr:CYTH domain-containing protein [Burkholderiales bacterium]
MQEIELKFQIPDSALDTVLAAVRHLPDTAPSQHLQAAYFDTPDRKLARARAALRVRQEDEEWVQTLKASAANPMIRLEDNVATSAPVAGEPIAPNLGLHQGDAATALQRDLGWTPATDPMGRECGLIQLYRTDMQRHRAEWQVTDADGHSIGWVEMAVDLGSISAGEHTTRVQELEIELVSGSPEAVLACGRDWVERFGLWLDVQTKAHRGDQLARQSEIGTYQPAAPARPKAKQPTWSAALQATVEQITFNMSELASPSHHATFDKGPWQKAWLVGLRRLTLLLRHLPEQQALRARAWHLFQQGRQLTAAQCLPLARSTMASQMCLDLIGLCLDVD